MKVSKILGTLMPSHPDIVPIIENIREKYQLPEVAIVSTTSEIKTRDWPRPVSYTSSVGRVFAKHPAKLPMSKTVRL